MDKKILLLVVAAACLVLYFYGSQIQKDNKIIQALPILGGLAYGLNTLVQLVPSEEPKDQDNFTPTHHRQKQV